MPSPQKRATLPNLPSLWKINSASRCHLSEGLQFCSLVLLCFSSLCFCCTYPKERGRGEGCLDGGRKKQGRRENLRWSFIKKKIHQNQNNNQSQRVMANCPESLFRGFSKCPFYLLWVNPGHCGVLGRSEALPNRPHQSHGKLRCHFPTWNRISPPWCVLRPLPPSPSCLLLPNELTCMMNISAHGLSNRQHY